VISTALISRRLAVTASLVAAVGAFVFLVASWIARPFVGGDTPFVLDGTNAFLTCLSHHDFDACGFTGELNYWGLMSPIGWWPLLQHVPDLITIGLGGDGHPARTRVLASLSVAGVVASVGLGWLVLRRVGQAAWFWGFLFIALSGPILAFGRQTAGEMLAMGLLVCLVAATVLRAPPLVVAFAALGACLTKETSYPFVAALGLLGLVLARRRTGRPIVKHAAWGVAGMAVAIVAASLFNEVRFGSVVNTNYLDSQLRTPGIARTAEYTLAVFVSPSGGLFFSWPAASLLVAAACLLPLVTAPFRSAYTRPALVLIAVIAPLAVGFASWWTPFGWSGYGPRLQLPWILPLVLIALVAYGDALGRLVRRLLARPWRLLLVLAIALACTLPHIGYLWDFESLNGYFSQEQPLCNAPWRAGVGKWHACQSRLLWQDRPMPLYTLDGLGNLGGVSTSVIVALGLAGCLILLRDGLAPRAEARASRARPPRRRTQPAARVSSLLPAPPPRPEASSGSGHGASGPPSRPPP
jgi:hypothetical protein